MRVLYGLESPSWLRHELEVLEELASRGHEVAVAFQDSRDPGGLLRELATRVPDVRLETIPTRASLRRVALLSRELYDLGLYGEPELRRAAARRARWQQKASPNGAMRHVTRAGFALVRAAPGRLTARVLHRLEHLIPPDPAHVELLRKMKPSLVVVNGLVQVGSSQTELVKAARELQVPSVYAVASWDNLSTKGRIKEDPSVVLVWNDALAAETERFHRVGQDRVVITGAPRFDPWFACSTDDDQAGTGLHRDEPSVLYLGSSRSIAPDEVPFARELAEWLARDPRTADLRVTVLPHPQNQEQWRDVRDTRLTIVRRDGFPVGQRESALLRTYLRDADAIVAVNTSAVLEAAVLGRRVLSIRHQAFEETFSETFHMRYLLEDNGGSVHLAGSPEDFVDAVADERDPSVRANVAPKAHAFAGSFLRPRGRSVPVAPIVVDELERLAAAGSDRSLSRVVSAAL